MIFEFTDMNRRNATTEIEQYGNLIIATELATNEGASVTNSAEYIATQYAGRHNIPLDKIIFVERYDSRSYENGRKPLKGEFPTHDLVTFSIGERNGRTHLTTTQWKRITEEELNALIERESA